MTTVQRLATARPHTPAHAQFSRDQWPVYCEGYYMGIVMSLKVMEACARTREARRAARPPARVARKAV